MTQAQARARAYADWLLVETFRSWREAGDVGLGDTVKHAVDRGTLGLAPFIQHAIARLGMDCGCDSRRRALNERYPYAR